LSKISSDNLIARIDTNLKNKLLTQFMEPHEIKNDDDYKVYLTEQVKKEAHWNKRRIHYDPIIKPRIIYWFVHLSTEPPTVLGFIRGDKYGWRVIGGLTGSHMNGHGEGWWGKFVKIISSEYMAIEEAVVKRLVPPDWSPPPLSDSDADRIDVIQKNGRNRC
jgi:hypothetical protein